MTQSPRERAYEARAALERAAGELRTLEEQLEWVLLTLDIEGNTLRDLANRIGGVPAEVCNMAADRLILAEEVEMLNTVRSSLVKEIAQLIEDADQALQLRLQLTRGTQGKPAT